MKTTNSLPNGIPVNRFNEAVARLRMYRQLAFVAVMANTILALLGVIYL